MENKIEIYESLLNELSSLEKECAHLSIDYFREFGDEINNIFSLKIEVITLKKKINYCNKKINKKEEIDLDKMDEYINKVIKKYNDHLEEMVEYKRKLDEEKDIKVTYEEGKNIKAMYYRIVHLIHPDLHPELEKNKKIKELWQKSVDAYERNDLKTLKLAFDQIIIIISNSNDIHIDNIDEKINMVNKDIKHIKENNPYLYKSILSNESEILKIHKENDKILKDYTTYIESLQSELDNILENYIRKNEA